MDRNRQLILVGLLVVVGTLTAAVLLQILELVVFAITVAYVLYPIRERLRRQGFSRRLASAVATACAFVAAIVITVPLAYTVYRRRNSFIATIRRIPEDISVTVADTTYVVELEPYSDVAETFVRDLAVSQAVALPGYILGLTVFTIVIYGILYRPRSIQGAVSGVVPEQYHDIPHRLHEQTRATLYSIYILQVTTAVVTFVIALVVFLVLGVDTPVWLATIAGVLQFIPIIGPSLLVVALAGNEFVLGNTGLAVAILVLGLVFISFLPDAVVRTQLASITGDMSVTLYFVGFVGGVLTVGAIGLIVGPLVVALLAEVVALLSEHTPAVIGESSPTTPDTEPGEAGGQ